MKILLYTLLCLYCASCVNPACSEMTSPKVLTRDAGYIDTLKWSLEASDSCQWILSTPNHTDVLLRVTLIKMYFLPNCTAQLIMPDGNTTCQGDVGKCFHYTKSPIPTSCNDDISGSACEAATLTHERMNAPNFTYNQDAGGLSRGFKLKYEFINCAATGTPPITTTQSTKSTPPATTANLIRWTKAATSTTTTTPTPTKRASTVQTMSNDKSTSSKHQVTSAAPFSVPMAVTAAAISLCLVGVIVAGIFFLVRRSSGKNDKEEGGNKIRQRPVIENNAAFVTSHIDEGHHEGVIAHHYEEIEENNCENLPSHAAPEEENPYITPLPATGHVRRSGRAEEPAYMIPIKRRMPSYMEFQI